MHAISYTVAIATRSSLRYRYVQIESKLGLTYLVYSKIITVYLTFGPPCRKNTIVLAASLRPTTTQHFEDLYLLVYCLIFIVLVVNMDLFIHYFIYLFIYFYPMPHMSLTDFVASLLGMANV